MLEGYSLGAHRGNAGCGEPPALSVSVARACDRGVLGGDVWMCVLAHINSVAQQA